jgi:hypothetical protein
MAPFDNVTDPYILIRASSIVELLILDIDPDIPKIS